MSGLSEADREALAIDLLALSGKRRDWDGLTDAGRSKWLAHADAISPTVEAVRDKAVAAALNEAALRIAEFDASDDYHQSDIEAPGYYSALFRAESLLRGEIRVWTDPPALRART